LTKLTNKKSKNTLQIPGLTKSKQEEIDNCEIFSEKIKYRGGSKKSVLVQDDGSSCTDSSQSGNDESSNLSDFEEELVDDTSIDDNNQYLSPMVHKRSPNQLKNNQFNFNIK
jgi:hypothetical protein